MESYYEINISLNGKHFFATAPRSIHTRGELKEKFGVLKTKFPIEEGYKLDVVYWECVGHHQLCLDGIL